MVRLGLAIAPLHVGQNTLKGIAAGDRVAAVIDVEEVYDLFATPVQDCVAVFLAELVKRRVDREAVVLGQRVEHLEVIEVTSVPAANSPFRQREGLVYQDAIFIEVLLEPESVAGVASASRIIKREEPGLELGNAVPTCRAGKE